MKTFIYKSILLVLVFFPPPLFAAPGDILYQNCTSASTCTGAGSSTGWVRTVETSGCQSGSCLKLVSSYNSGLGRHGATNTSINVGSAIDNYDEITVVSYVKFNKNIGLINGGNIKWVRPYTGDSNDYFGAVMMPWYGRQFYSSHNKGTTTPESSFDPYDESDTFVGDTRYMMNQGNGTWTAPEGRIVGHISPDFGASWTKIRFWLKLPTTTSSADGEIKLWVNEVLQFHTVDAQQGDNLHAYFTGLNFYPSSEAEEQFEHWVDEMIIYEGYVPPSSEPVNGACGSNNGGSLPSLSSGDPNNCNSGIEANFSGSGPWTWDCNGLNGGTTDNCSVAQAGMQTSGLSRIKAGQTLINSGYTKIIIQ